MPDENGDLTEPEKKSIEKWNAKYRALSCQCSMCGNTDWRIQQKLSGTQEVTIVDGKMKGASSGITVMSIQCGSCGHIVNFNARAVGIL